MADFAPSLVFASRTIIDCSKGYVQRLQKVVHGAIHIHLRQAYTGGGRLIERSNPSAPRRMPRGPRNSYGKDRQLQYCTSSFMTAGCTYYSELHDTGYSPLLFQGEGEDPT